MDEAVYYNSRLHQRVVVVERESVHSGITVGMKQVIIS